MNHRLTGLALLAVIALTACGRASSTTPAAAGYRIFLEEGFNGGSERITVRDSGSGALERELPLGTPAPDWSRYYTVTPLTGSARLSALDQPPVKPSPRRRSRPASPCPISASRAHPRAFPRMANG
jgi:hypothetical protein